MSVIATLGVPAEDFILGASLAADPEVRIRLERVVPVGERFFPYLWVPADGIEVIEVALEEAASVDGFRIVDRANDAVLVRIDWAEGADGFIEALARSGATVLDGIGEGDRWQLQLRFEDHHQLTRFYGRCLDGDIAVDLERVHTNDDGGRFDTAVDLTPSQRETLELALAEGYFEVPRQTDLAALAAELGVSDVAVSQRLRRGLAQAVARMDLERGDRTED